MSDRFRAALQDNHTVTTRVELLVDGAVALTFDADSDTGILSGTVTVDLKAKHRRRLALTMTDADYSIVPEQIGSMLAPPNELRLWQGIRFGEDPLDEEFAPLGVYGISKPEVTEAGAGVVIVVDGYDRSRKVSRSKYEVPWVTTRGTNVATAIASLLADRAPMFPPLNATPTSATTPLLIFGEEENDDPWEDAVRLAADNALDLFIDAQGVPVLRPAPDASTDEPVARYVEGEGEGEDEHMLVSASRAFDDEPGYNGVLVIGEGSEIAEPFRVLVWDDDEDSPTYYLGPWGKVPEIVISELILTEAQALETGRARLRSRLGTVEDVRFSAVGNPAHDGGDVIAIRRPRLHLDASYILESLTITLGPGTMEAVCRPRVVTT